MGHQVSVCYSDASTKYEAGTPRTDTNDAHVEVAVPSTDHGIGLCKSIIKFKEQGTEYITDNNTEQRRKRNQCNGSPEKDTSFVKSQFTTIIISGKGGAREGGVGVGGCRGGGGGGGVGGSETRQASKRHKNRLLSVCFLISTSLFHQLRDLIDGFVCFLCKYKKNSKC